MFLLELAGREFIWNKFMKVAQNFEETCQEPE